MSAGKSEKTAALNTSRACASTRQFRDAMQAQKIRRRRRKIIAQRNLHLVAA